jgi:hypothetical protein
MHDCAIFYFCFNLILLELELTIVVIMSVTHLPGLVWSSVRKLDV